MEKVLRVATLNNFNYTDKEFEQMRSLEDNHPEYNIFINSNSYQKIRGKFPAVVTINPSLAKFTEPKGDREIIKAVRVKYVADAKPKIKKAFDECVAWAYKYDIPILITYMRFRSLSTLKNFARTAQKYKWRHNYYRQVLKEQFDLDLFHYCDIREEGCPSCQNCAKLPFGFKGGEIYSINLSSSGECPYNCPDCYAKNMSKWGNLAYDRILKNTKMKGHKSFHSDLSNITTLEEFIIHAQGGEQKSQTSLKFEFGTRGMA